LIESASAGSFRDPSGFVFTKDGSLYRQVNLSFREQFDSLIDSGLYQALVDEGLLVPHQEVDPGLAAAPGAYKILRPEPIEFVSYPYEWSFSQLKDAALTTLRLQQRAMDFGMSLRDASAYNIQFRRGKPILIDTLSFEPLKEGEPWVAYRQFCQHFLAPLALIHYHDVRLGQLSRIHIDGVPLDLTARMLPTRARFRPALYLHVFAHAKTQKRHEGASADETKKRTTGRRFTLQAFRGLVESLRSVVGKMTWTPDRSVWSEYYAEGHNYTQEGVDHKRRLVGDFLTEADPKSVWDLGGNVGVFSRIASARGIPTVCFDIDPSCVEANYRAVATKGEENILPVLLDLTNPSPSIGWENRERLSVKERGPTDTILALALIHHLAIANNVPLQRVAGYFADLCRSLIIEFVPKTDSMVQTLLASREDIFPNYTVEGFEHAFSERFSIDRREQIVGSGRILYLMRRR
jgi:hypothetical protein